MDHAKFCTATQGWSTVESIQSDHLLRPGFLNKQEGDHGQPARAIPLRGTAGRKSEAD
jgi:hypothetical protein